VKVGDNDYKPLLYHVDTDESATDETQNPPPQRAPAASQTLSELASDLNLPETARRQLFGRKNAVGNVSAISVVNFNADAEWAANEAARLTGELEAQKGATAVRAVAPGRHSLKQLVNSVSSQKEALEEQFAANRRNQRDAAKRYGW